MTFEKEKREIELIYKEIGLILKKGGVGIIPTDTLYGFVGCALDEEAVEKIYKIRKRGLKKSMIILISSLKDLEKFGVKMSLTQKKFLQKVWPGKISVILKTNKKNIDHLTRGGKTLAFRMPADRELLELLKKSGPLVAPSANLEGEKPAETYAESKKYFGDKVDFYVDAGKLSSKPSTLVELAEDGNYKLLREGAVNLK